MLDRSRDYERELLGAVVLDAQHLSALESTLRADHFGDQRHRAIYTAMCAMATSGRPIDVFTLRDEIGSAVDVAYLAALTDGLPRIADIREWGKVVREQATLRALQSLGKRLASEAGSPDADARALLDRLQAATSRLADTEDHGLQTIASLLPEAIREIDRFADAEDGVTGIPTGLPDLDRLTSGLGDGQLWVIGACPSRGKSAACMQMALHAALCGHPVLVFSMEMPPVSMVVRAIYHTAKLDKWDLKRPSRTADAWSRIQWARDVLAKLPITFDPKPSPTVAQIRASAKQHATQKGVDLIVVDYLQRCALPDGDEERRWVAVGDIAKNLKTMAHTLNVPVLTACQLRMDAAMRRPNLGDLAQARQVIAAEADLIAFIHPDDPGKFQDHEFPLVHLFVDKQRNGATDDIDLYFERRFLRFESAAGQEARTA